MIATTVRLILTHSGFYAKSFVDPSDALQAARLEPPNLLISDVMMPGMNGIELAIQVTELHPGCKVLLISGAAATQKIHQDARAQGYDFELLAKPVHPTELLTLIEELFVK